MTRSRNRKYSSAVDRSSALSLRTDMASSALEPGGVRERCFQKSDTKAGRVGGEAWVGDELKTNLKASRLKDCGFGLGLYDEKQ